MRKLLIEPRARLDMLEIWHYIAADNRDAAETVWRTSWTRRSAG